MSLNPRQLQAVRHLDGPCLVLAGAGSGKTRVITQKIAYLIEECGISAKNIAALTFTNKSSREMKERVGKLLNAKAGRGLQVSTFHTLGLNIIRQELKTLGYKPNFSIFDAQDSAALIKELLRREYGDDGGIVEEMQWQISRWKSALIGPAEAPAEADGDETKITAAALYEQYQRALKAYNAVDFDDLILQPARLFIEHPDVLERWQNKIRYLLVDEYQDTNASQYQLIKTLVGVRGALTVVGDDDQSIYAWRGAEPENMLLLQKDYPNLTVIKLEQNYRSTGIILKAANALIKNNPHVFDDKKLWSELGYGEPIKIITMRNDEHEAEQIVSELISHKFQKRTKFSDYAILYRGNHQSRLIERSLREQRVPYHITGGTSFFSHTEVKDIMAYMRILANPDDDAAFLRVVNTPRREIGPTTLERLGNYASERNLTLFAASFELGLEQCMSEKAVQRIRRFTDWVVDISDRASRGDPINTVKDLLCEINYEAWLNDSSKDIKQAEKRMANVWELVTWLQRVYENSDKDKNLADLVNHMSLMDMLDRNDDDAGENVSLMTLHASKGLEFPHVYLIGVEEEILPHRVSLEEGNVEEERRLAYVGITRAQKTLTISLCARRKRAGELLEMIPSRFLDELPEEDLEWRGIGQQIAPEESQERGKAHLANLRGMLSKK